ncbi:MAG TPA: universal stress protein [Kineosporiaceae bacterium]|nr:universal stress protein [Kineosporiaceae bacterium]
MTESSPARGSSPESALTGPVIVGYDADSSGTDALALGIGLGTALGLPVIVAKVHASPAPIGSGRVDAEWVADRRAASAAVLSAAKRQAEELHLSADAATAIEYRLVPSSSAARGLHDLAESESAALIVVGSAATEGFDRRVFAGSTASRLLSGAAWPVVVAPKGLAGAGWKGPQRIGVAYLATDEGLLAVQTAADIARRTGGSLHLFTAVAEEASVLPWLVGVDGEQAFAATVREGVQRALDEAVATTEGLPVDAGLLVGDVVRLLADLPDIDLLICGSRGYGPIRRVLLGGVSSRLMRRSVNPLLVVPRP